MTAHAPHTDVHIFGLADGCPRCKEEAEDPSQMDNQMLRALALRCLWHWQARSAHEGRAMAKMNAAISVCRRAGLLAPQGAEPGTSPEEPIEIGKEKGDG